MMFLSVLVCVSILCGFSTPHFWNHPTRSKQDHPHYRHFKMNITEALFTIIEKGIDIIFDKFLVSLLVSSLRGSCIWGLSTDGTDQQEVSITSSSTDVESMVGWPVEISDRTATLIQFLRIQWRRRAQQRIFGSFWMYWVVHSLLFSEHNIRYILSYNQNNWMLSNTMGLSSSPPCCVDRDKYQNWNGGSPRLVFCSHFAWPRDKCPTLWPLG